MKGYPIGTFIFWKTEVRFNVIKNIGNFQLPDTPAGDKVEYVLDGQQRITSLFAAYRGAEIQKTGEKRKTDYRQIFVTLNKDISENDGQLITARPAGERRISLSEVLEFDYGKLSKKFSQDELATIYSYNKAFDRYRFSTVVLRRDDIDSAIEVFTRINTSGQDLTLFEIMSAKTYDEEQDFDMQAKWEGFIKELEDIQYEGVSNTVVLNLLSLVRTKECKRKTILALDKQVIIDTWDAVISALKDSIDYFRTTYRIPVSQILPFDALLASFAYFFFFNKEQPRPDQRKYLEEFFWRMSLSYRYSSSTESRLAQDIRRIDLILENEHPDYSDIKVDLDQQLLIDKRFSAGNSFCKAVLCLLVYQEPKNFQDDSKVILDNSWLKRANSKNYHHFFPKKHLKNKGIPNSNSIVNITFVSDRLNKKIIGARAPSKYIAHCEKANSDINKSLNSHLIDLVGFGIESDDYETFLKARSERIVDELKTRIDLSHEKPVSGKGTN